MGDCVGVYGCVWVCMGVYGCGSGLSALSCIILACNTERRGGPRHSHECEALCSSCLKHAHHALERKDPTPVRPPPAPSQNTHTHQPLRCDILDPLRRARHCATPIQ